MSTLYDEYLQSHKEGVRKAYYWIEDNLPEIFPGDEHDYEWQICYMHDNSKDKPSEYNAYDAYFYGGNRSAKVVEEFNKAWLLHIHRNPHHWQFWVLINDDPESGEIILDMDYSCIIEMICDWWSFSWRSGKLDEIFNWYEQHKDYMKLSAKTRETVEGILEKIKVKLNEIVDVVNGVGNPNIIMPGELRNILDRLSDAEED